MENTPEEWLKKSISDGYINYLEYNKFSDPAIIGAGAFGKVFKCEWKDCELMVAFKCLKIDTNLRLDEKIIKDLLKRRVSNHPNIISFYGVTKNCDGHYLMVMQYANEETLREYLKAEFDNLQWEDKLHIAREIHSDFYSYMIIILFIETW
ncbi:kinase-like protein [Gigaspora margarita]|uniref:Kinase-like protein n=1 Tax=Gigaspora margarita TaxID=4874 RepID=A0A8H3XED0_GIGMA|nr:kinase-like protein [Gigaspora margarita]